MNYWLVKSEPGAFSWQDLLKDKKTLWDGVRNYQARNNLKAMKLGDLVLMYHSVNEKQVMGICKVTKEHFPDPTTDDDRWVVVELVPVSELSIPVTLEAVKSNPKLANIPLIKQSRLSVMPLTRDDFDTIVELGTPEEK
jgi:predicted RNA-binding protein with PUA-like domain